MNGRNFGGSDARYEVNATRPSKVIAFDTDHTMMYADGPVPLPHVIALREDPDVAVYATGFNQSLRDHAAIPGMVEIKEMSGMNESDWVPRADRMRLLDEIHPKTDCCMVVDDVDLRQLEREEWRYFHPIEYAIENLGETAETVMDEARVATREYLKAAGRFPEQFPPDELRLDADNPRRARMADGVRTPAHKRDGYGSGTGADTRFASAYADEITDGPSLEDRVDAAFERGDGQ